MFDKDETYMQLALAQAQLAFDEDEVPIGAVLVKNGLVVASNHNRTRQMQNPLAHAELLIIEELLNGEEKFLHDYTLYVTVEPCLMCAGMMIWSRLGTLVFGTYDAKAGAVGSIYHVLKNKHLNHHPDVRCGILADECKNLIQKFFKQKRK